MAKKRSTIFINYLEKKYRALIVEMRNDNSIYIYYPNKNGYFVSHKQEIQFSNTKFQEIFSFGVNNSNEIYNPYISYHPGKGVVHANAKDKDESIVPLIKDRDTSTLEDLIKRPEFVPVCSVLFSTNITNFEEAVPTKEDYVLELSKKYKFSDQDDALYIEVFAMSKAGYLDPMELKFKEHRHLIGIEHIELNEKTAIYYAIVMNSLPRDRKDDNQILNFVWSKEDPIMFVLKPMSDHQ